MNALREEAKERLARQASFSEQSLPKEAKDLIHELRVQQLALEMQNEALGRVQAELEESRERYSALYEFARLGYLTFDEGGVVLEANATAAGELGVERQALIGRSFPDYVGKADRGTFREHLREVFSKGQRGTCELRLKRGDKTTIFGRLESMLVRDARGNDVCRTSVIDVTERVRARQALEKTHAELERLVEERTAPLAETNEELRLEIAERERAEEELQTQARKLQEQAALFDLAPDAVMVRSMDHTIVFWNEGAAANYGWTKEEALGKNSDTLLQTQFPKALGEIEAELLQEGRWDGELVQSRRDGRRIVAASRWILQKDNDGRPVAVLEINTDITARKELDEERLRASKLESIGVLAGGIGHDFNNMLTAILGHLSLTKIVARPGDGVLAHLQEAETASLQAKELTQRLLAFAEIGAPTRKVSHIGQTVRDAAVFAARGSNSECRFYIPSDLWAAEVDEGQIAQVITNLIINARQAMAEGGVINVRAENAAIGAQDRLPLKHGDYVRVSIEDHGVGIPAEQLPKVFDPFFTTRERGRGLGLATAYSVVKNHHGYITVESEVGVGTIFRLYLPASRGATRTEAGAKEVPLSRTPPGKGRVLIMDDEQMVRKVAGAMLTHMGYQVEYAEDGAQAVDLYVKAKGAGGPFLFVIMDLTIPAGMGGEEAIKRLLEIDPAAKAIVSSGYANDRIMANFKDYGFEGVVAKPYELDELREVVDSVTKA